MEMIGMARNLTFNYDGFDKKKQKRIISMIDP
jgi:hypothetical protein